MKAGLSDLYPALPIFFVISLVLLLLPVWGFIKGRNTAVLFYVGWIFLGNAIYYVDMLVWHDSVANFAPVYCDIVSVLIVMLPIGISCSLLCKNILVWQISRSTTLIVYHTNQRVIVDSLICFGIPVVFAGFHVLVQNKRFTIVEDIGCMPSTDHSLPSLFIYYLPPSIICCCIASVFCFLSLLNFYRTRYRANSILQDPAQTAISFNRYIRLILLCTTSLLFIATFLVSMVIQNAKIGFSSAIAWANSSWDFTHVESISRNDLDANPRRKTLLLLQLLPLPVLALHFFLFFGIGEEAMRNYRNAFSSIVGLLRKLGPKRRDEEDDTPMSARGTARQLDLYAKRPSPIPYIIPFPPPIFIPPPLPSNLNFLIVEDRRRSSAYRPSSGYLVPSPSVSSSRTSISVSAGHFPYPPPHFFHEHPYASHPMHEPRCHEPTYVNNGITTHATGIEAGLDLNTGSTRSRFSVYSETTNSPVRERRLTHVFSWGRRPTHSI